MWTVIALILVAIFVLLISHYVLRPFFAMRPYLAQGAYNIGYYPYLGAFGKSISQLSRTKDILKLFKDIGQLKPKPDFCITNIVHRPYVYLLNPDLIKEFISKNDCYQRDRLGMEHFEVLFGAGILIANGSNWAKRRKLLSSLFHFSNVKEMGSALCLRIKELFLWQKDRIDVMKLSQSASVQNIMQFVFGPEEKVRSLTEKMANAMQQINFIEIMNSPLFILLRQRYFTWGVNAHSRRIVALCNETKQYATQLIDFIQAERDKGTLVKGSMISNYLQSVDKKLSTRTQLIQDIINLFLAGKDTSAAVITISSYYLCAYPDWQTKIRTEADQHGHEHELAYQDIEGMECLHRFVFEVLRHSGFPNSFLNRMVIEDHELLGIQMTRGTTVTPLVSANFYDDSYFPDCQKFDPDRYLDQKQASMMASSMAFLPFGAGPRSCIGKALALVTVKAFICQLVRMFEFKLPDNYDYILGFPKSLGPKNPIILEILKLRTAQ